MKSIKDQYELTDFVKDMTAAVETEQDDAALVSKAEHLVGKLIQNKSWFPSEKIAPNRDHYARYSLYVDPLDRFEVLALVWAPGQSTPLHDHDGTWGVEGVFNGRIKVTNYLQSEKISEDVVKLRYSGTMTVGEHSTGQLLPPADCHILEAADDQSAITIHVYGKQLNKFKIFQPLNDKGAFKAYDHEVGYTTKLH
ncbi:putative metal-dependent enzyme (double-stranded beta helix superfamily) [Scopulibacillus daqui]|uniref:Metal-dependent enzyme (Double-stranded beta helix superfamily) n=1 Tax=Scopulibacillus daqui TaxID=1469162 RepID=A0ABS2PY37_9BACL|nr:cysteine dioxygenase family protein [Scopulibacillus daqui]MBM7644620.1 putative metal-dependent enzyme (double-stranded beta helix superfamily) [Scopulibacillus daqui]